ncbi:NAD(P)-binding protein [Auricularia subglabra TFB-10046 SS5]|nr:NAD(P)-binding protein [Auricularia subglabra TFB-10046 SS5]
MSPKPKWTQNDMPDCTGMVYIVTGGNTGIGKETVKALLTHGGKVYMAARSINKAAQAIAELEAETGKRAIFLELDLASLDSVKRAASSLAKRRVCTSSSTTGLRPHLCRPPSRTHHVLRGVMIPPIDQLTSDGYDLQFGTNTLGHWYLTKLLLPILLATADASPSGEKTRVIHTSSDRYSSYPKINYEALRDSATRRGLGKWNLYGQSKFGNLVVSRELDRRYSDKIVAIGLHPGVIKTELQRHMGFAQSGIGSTLSLTVQQSWFLKEPSEGAITQLYAGTAPEAAELGGNVHISQYARPVSWLTLRFQYLVPLARLGEPKAEVNVPETEEVLWAWLEAQVQDV